MKAKEKEINILTEAVPAVTLPFSLKIDFRDASFSSVVARGCSSAESISGPFLPLTSIGASSAANLSALCAETKHKNLICVIQTEIKIHTFGPPLLTGKSKLVTVLARYYILLC